jgi:hypothetical protein
VRTLRTAGIVVLLSALSACSKKAPAPAAQSQAKTSTNAIGGKGDGNGNGAPPDGLHGTRKLKGIDVPVYVDGSEIAVLRYGETPTLENVGTASAPAFRIYDYLKSSGVAVDAVKSVYFYDATNRIGSLEGSELRADKNRFMFHFSSGEAGNAETLWDTVGLKNNFIIHEIRKMVVFVAKAAPAIDKTHSCIMASDGHCSEDVPFSTPELAKGTRIYVDGHMVGYVKRRMLADSTIVGTSTDGEHYSLAKFMTSLGVDNAKVQSVELVAGDDVIARADANEWAKDSSNLYFTLQKHEHGKGHMHVPAGMQTNGAQGDRDAMATAVLVHQNSAASNREVVAISEETEMSARLASNDARQEDDTAGGGSGTGSGSGNN